MAEAKSINKPAALNDTESPRSRRVSLSHPAAEHVAHPRHAVPQKKKYASEQEAIEGLKAFVMSLGVEYPAETEAELLMQAAPYMSESLEANLRTAWTPEERARLDASPVPEQLDHQNRDHEYIFFKQMRQSLERRMSRSSSSSKQDSVEQRPSVTKPRSVESLAAASRSSGDSMPSSPPVLTAEEASRRRAEQRRVNLGAVWGETGRDVLKALDALPESDVLLDADDGATPPASPTYVALSEDAEEDVGADGDKNIEDSKMKKFFCW